jgi:hypothetical protein
MAKLIRLFIGDGLKEPLQAIAKTRVCFSLVRLPSTVTGMSRSTVSNARSESI